MSVEVRAGHGWRGEPCSCMARDPDGTPVLPNVPASASLRGRTSVRGVLNGVGLSARGISVEGRCLGGSYPMKPMCNCLRRARDRSVLGPHSSRIQRHMVYQGS